MHRRFIVLVLFACACAIEVDDPFPGPGGPVGGDTPPPPPTDGGSGGNGESGDAGDAGTGEDGGAADTSDGGGTDDGGPSVDYDTMIQPIWNAYCIACHGTNRPDEGLDLTQGAQVLVDVPSQQLRSMPLVTPGSTESSYLWRKLVGDQASVGGSGDQMPERAPALGSAEMNAIASWIDAGAPY